MNAHNFKGIFIRKTPRGLKGVHFASLHAAGSFQPLCFESINKLFLVWEIAVKIYMKEH